VRRPGRPPRRPPTEGGSAIFFRGGPRVPPQKNSPINEYILRFQAVRLISSTGEQVGVVEPQAALAQGRAEGLDVVVIAEQADPPVCKVMDFGKFTFEKKKKEHESKKKQKVTQVKEIKFRPNIDDHDYDFKLKNIERSWRKGQGQGHDPVPGTGDVPASTTDGRSWPG